MGFGKKGQKPLFSLNSRLLDKQSLSAGQSLASKKLKSWGSIRWLERT
jgi:hypothetical protein